MPLPEFPILEFDSTSKAIIEPGEQVPALEDIPQHCVITFFREVLEKLHKNGQAKIIATHRWADTDRHLYELEIPRKTVHRHSSRCGRATRLRHFGRSDRQRVPQIYRMWWMWRTGSRNRSGGFDRTDFSYPRRGNFVPLFTPREEVQPSLGAVSAIEEVLSSHKIPYRLGKTWTTDAPYRETPQKVQLRRDEGCLTVEMEAASFFAVAQFRNVTMGQILYGGDDVSGEVEWDQRDWH